MAERIQRGSETHYLSYISSPDGLVAMHISDDAGRDEMKYVLTDYLGTIYALVDDGAQSTEDALYYSFNAWGERRELQAYDGSLAAPLFSDPADYITSRGYTGHEHIDAFDLINMNGRAYDPVVGAFLSPDPYVQAPDMPQNLNRYAYCLNNPLKYSDPSGEFFIEAMMIGAFTNIFFQGVTGNLHNLGDALFAGGIGALSGSAGFGAGQFVSNLTVLGGFWGGAITGGASGFGAGFVSGTGNGWVNGSGFLDGLFSGFKSGLVGAVSGAVIGGISQGIHDSNVGLSFWQGRPPQPYELAPFEVNKIELYQPSTTSKAKINVDGTISEIKPFVVSKQLEFDGNQLMTVRNYSDGSQCVEDSYAAISGNSKGQNALPSGDYSCSNLRIRTDYRMVREGVGFSLNLDPKFETTRTLLRIHPDGNLPGTLGCIGLKESAIRLNRFYNSMARYFRGNSNSINLNVY